MSVQPIAQKSLPRVSVIVAAYRSGLMLLQAIHSVLLQNWPNLELIVCDDGTEAFDPSVIERLFIEQDRAGFIWKILHHPQNVGTVCNLNAGLRQCSGTWVLLLAADDALATPDTVTQLMRLTVQSGQTWVIGRNIVCDKDLCPTGTQIPTNEEQILLESGDRIAIYTALCRRCFLPSSGGLYQMKLLRELGLLDECFRLVEDWPLFLKAVRWGLIPQISPFNAVLHRSGGISKGMPGSNQVYQQDLVRVMERKILPYLNILPEQEQAAIRQRYQDKLAVYRLRFETFSMWSRLWWFLKHPKLLLRKYTERIMGKYD